jgi:hypothetical protein
MNSARIVGFSVLALAASVCLTAQTKTAAPQALKVADPFVGTWKLNVAKSTYKPGPAPKSGSVTFSVVGAGVKVVVDGVAATGEATHWTYTANYDGKDYPVTGNVDADTATLRKINPRTVEVTNKKAGKVTLVNTRAVSANGKTLSVTTKGTNAQGQTVNNVQVFDKG